MSVYTFVAALLLLAVPLTMQALVNTIAAGIFVQPVIALALIVFGGLLTSGGLQIMQHGVVESLQQRVFARAALDLAGRLGRVQTAALRGEYAPELVNRFFDVLTVQKALSKLLLDALTAVAQALVAVVVLGFFSPSLLAVALGLVTLFLVGTFALGTGGMRSSLAESAAKYRVVEWLEDVARCHVGLKLHGNPEFVVSRADRAVMEYLEARQSHFRTLRRQLAGFFLLAALANGGLFLAGGWLVLNGDLTLGQLVAAQIIVALVIASLDKLVRSSEVVFDLLTGLEKVGHLTDLPFERRGGLSLPARPAGSGVAVVLRGVRFAYGSGKPVLDGLDLTVEPGERVSLVGANGTGKSTLAALLCGLEEPSMGVVEIDGVDVRDADLEDLRRHIALVNPNGEIVDGTVAENVILDRDHITQEDLQAAYVATGLDEMLRDLPQGARSHVVSGGANLSRGMGQRILIARAIVDHPRLLILDEGLSGVEERLASEILTRLCDPVHGWTVLDISHEPSVVARATRVHVLGEGKILESGPPDALARVGGPFASLFPYLAAEGAGR